MEESGLVRTTENRQPSLGSGDSVASIGVAIRSSSPLAIVDFLALIGAHAVAVAVIRTQGWMEIAQTRMLYPEAGLVIAFMIAAVASMWWLRIAWRLNSISIGSAFVTRVFAIAAIIAALLAALAGSGHDLRYGVVVSLAALILAPAAHLLARLALRLSTGASAPGTSVIFVGSAETAAVASRRFLEIQRNYTVAGIVGPTAVALSNGHAAAEVPHLGSLPSLASVVNQTRRRNGTVLVAVEGSRYSAVRSVLESDPSAQRTGIALLPAFEGSASRAVAGTEAEERRQLACNGPLKRILDIILSVSMLVVTAPLFGIIALLIKIDSRGPVFYNQTRVGRRGQLFSMFKFRTMQKGADLLLDELADQNEAEGHMFKMAQDPRVTRVGRVIRRLSLDELPQLLNVALGTMSIVGPRPPLPHEVEAYEPWHFQRFDAAPGISGLWQVTRGDDISFEEMIARDLEYIGDWTLWMDLVILVKTIPAMLRGQGAY